MTDTTTSTGPDSGTRDEALRKRIADVLAVHRASLTTHVLTEHTCCAAALLPLVAAERAAGRGEGLREGAELIDADDACHKPAHRDYYAGLLRARADEITQEGA